MSPIRLALIGLSKAAKTSWAAEGHLPYLLSERGKQRYKIVALLNSSEDAAKRAIEHYDLGSDVKAYDSAQALAADPDVDLVACTTRVDVHYDTIRPSIEAGKAVYVEWPLAENVQRAKELAELAKAKKAPSIVGLQGRVGPVALKIQQLLRDDVVGKVLSSEVRAFATYIERGSVSEGLAYFLEKEVGGNPVTIAMGHMIDFIHTVLGEYSSSHSHTQIQRPNQIVRLQDGGQRSAISNVPDLVSIHGTLRPSAQVADGASLLVSYRSGPASSCMLPFEWVVTGEKGEIRVSSSRGSHAVAMPGKAETSEVTIEVHDFATDEVKEVGWEYEEWQRSLFPRGMVLGKLYDLYYEGKLEEYGAADFDSAVLRHAQVDEMLWT